MTKLTVAASKAGAEKQARKVASSIGDAIATTLESLPAMFVVASVKNDARLPLIVVGEVLA
jgi:hypothetical protein